MRDIVLKTDRKQRVRDWVVASYVHVYLPKYVGAANSSAAKTQRPKGAEAEVELGIVRNSVRMMWY